jgi:hypothetical protein
MKKISNFTKLIGKKINTDECRKRCEIKGVTTNARQVR